MPQWRKLHVKTTESLDINEMPDDFHRLLWVLLPLKLDKYGRGVDSPAWVKSKVLTLRMDVTIEMVQAALDWYANRGMLRRYSVNERHYFWVPTFSHYQGNTSREADSLYPPPPQDQDDAELTTYSRPTHDLLTSKSSTDADADVDIEEEEEEAPAANAFTAFERYVGPLSAGIADDIRDLVAETDVFIATLPRGSPGSNLSGDDWVKEAIRQTGHKADRPNWAYTQAIINNWRKSGYMHRGNRNDGNKPGSGKKQNKRGPPDLTDEERRIAAQLQ